MTTPTPNPAPDASLASEFGTAKPSHKRSLWKWSLAATAIVLMFLMWQCGSALYKGRGLAKAAVSEFHQKLNNEQYEDICQDADEHFAGTERHDETVKLLEAIHTKLGSAGVNELTNIRVNATTNGTFIVGQFKTTFERGTAVETFTWMKSIDDVLKLYGYNIQSNELVLN